MHASSACVAKGRPAVGVVRGECLNGFPSTQAPRLCAPVQLTLKTKYIMTCRQASQCDETREITTCQHASLTTHIANPLSEHDLPAETYIASCFSSWDTCSVAWGSYSRTTRTRENQDGWLVLRNVPDAQQKNRGTPQTKPCRLQWDDASGSYLYPGLPSECSPLKKRCTADFSSSQHNGNAISPQGNSVFSQSEAPTLLPCFPEAVTPVISRKNSPLFPLGSLNRKVALLSLIGNNGLLYDQEKTIASSNPSVSHEVQYLGDSQIPLMKTPAALGGCPLQDSQGSTPLSTKKLLTRTETCPALSTETSAASPWVFAVFDGHGSKGRIAAHLASKTLAQFLSKTQLNSNEDVPDKKFPVLEPTQNPIPHVLNRTKCKLEEAFNAMQQAILQSNVFHKQDFGTTAVVVASLGRYLVTATCGDSSAFLIVGAPRLSGDQTPSRTVINVQMSVDHSLRSSAEIERLRKHTKGRVVFGAGDVLRLIPASKTYPEARAEGLAINMARSLGHVILSQCGLSPQPSFTLLDIADIFELLFQHWKHTTSLRSETQLLTPAQSTANGFKHKEWLAPVLFFQAGMFDHTLQKKFPANPLASQETASTRAMTTEVSQSDASDCETSCFEHLEHADPVALLPQDVVAESSLPNSAITDRKSEAASLNQLQSETPTSAPLVTQTSVNSTCSSFSNPELATEDDEVDNVVVVVEHYEDGNSSKQDEDTELVASNHFDNKATHNSVCKTEKSRQHILKSETGNLAVPEQQKTSVAESKGRKQRHHWIPSKKTTQQIFDEKKKKQTPQYDGATADKLPRASQQQFLDGKPRSETKQTTTYGRGAFFNRLFGCVTKGDAPGKAQQLPHLMESKKREQQQTTDHCGNTRNSETLSKTYAATGQKNQSRASQQKQNNQRSHHSVQTEWAQSEAHGNVPTTEQMLIPAKKTGLYKYGFIQDMKKEAIQLNSKSDINVAPSSAVDPSAARSDAAGKPTQQTPTSKVDNSAGQIKQSEHILHKDCSYKMGTDEARLGEHGIMNNANNVQNLEAAAAITHLIERSSVFLVLVSDGISDVIPSQAIADYVLDHDLLGWDPLKIATMLTMKASTIRGDLQVRADNCTALVVKLQAENVKPPSFNDISK